MFLGLLTLMFFIDPSLRFRIGGLLGKFLYPVFGFEGRYPVLTLMFAGTMMVVFSTIVRHLFIDWLDMAEKQKRGSAFQSELREAKMENKTTKVKKLKDIQPKVSKMQMKTFKPQIKSMVLTMIVIISIFGWIWMFVSDLANKSFSVPWAPNATMTDALISGCFFPFPQWIGIYMLISLPFGQVVRMSLQWFTFSRKMKKEEGSEEGV